MPPKSNRVTVTSAPSKGPVVVGGTSASVIGEQFGNSFPTLQLNKTQYNIYKPFHVANSRHNSVQVKKNILRWLMNTLFTPSCDQIVSTSLPSLGPGDVFARSSRNYLKKHIGFLAVHNLLALKPFLLFCLKHFFIESYIGSIHTTKSMWCA